MLKYTIKFIACVAVTSESAKAKKRARKEESARKKIERWEGKGREFTLLQNKFTEFEENKCFEK